MRSNQFNTLTRPIAHRPVRHRGFSPDYRGLRSAGSQGPLTNILRTGKEITLELALPGISKEQIEIDVRNRILSVSVSLPEQHVEETADRFLRHEFKLREMRREFRLSDKIDAQSIDASMQDGILSIKLPLSAEDSTSKSIEIQ